VILLYVRWYLRYSLSYRNLEEMMGERGLSVDHSTIARRVLRYAPFLNERIRRRRFSGKARWMLHSIRVLWPECTAQIVSDETS
jgi:transposase, IS6 family